ncbi:MAG: carboxypeptidase M32, partial [Deltaproteobacteria bacterium]
MAGSTDVAKVYERFISLVREVHWLNRISDLLSWDQQVMMPPKGVSARSEQYAVLSGLAHDRLAGNEMADLLAHLEAHSDELDEDQRVNVREVRRSHDRARKVPRELIQEIVTTEGLSQKHWLEAKQKDDFSIFAPWLEKMVALKRRVADAIGYEKTPYDPLLDEFEPHTTSEEVAGVLEGLKPALVELVRRIESSSIRPRREILERSFPIAKQEEFGAWIVRLMGFDFEAGRIDRSPHPFCSGANGDVRITTRYKEDYIPASLFGLMHETGHGLYDQGLDPKHEGTPRGFTVSLGVHESQSRLWENLVGRSMHFWRFAFPFLQAF